MTNTTDKSILTAAGKALLAQLNAEEKPLVIDKMIFANVPNRPEFPQPDDVVPSDDVVHEAAVEQRGRLSVDSVIYSTTLTSQEGPFEFNWTGAYCSEYGVLVTIDHHALTPKSADEPGVAGNTLVRSVVLEYKDIAEITNITVDASTWQYNATPRMKKMDDDVAQGNIDQNGKDWFIEDGFLVTPQASAFNIKAGAGYVSGNRVMLEFDRNVQAPNKPSFIYVYAYREGTPTGEQVTQFDFVVTAEEKDDYTDGNGVKHFVCKVAQVLVDGSVSDLRPLGEKETREKVAGKLWEKGKEAVVNQNYVYEDEQGDISRWFTRKPGIIMGYAPDSNFERQGNIQLYATGDPSIDTPALKKAILKHITDERDLELYGVFEYDNSDGSFFIDYRQSERARIYGCLGSKIMVSGSLGSMLVVDNLYTFDVASKSSKLNKWINVHIEYKKTHYECLGVVISRNGYLGESQWGGSLDLDGCYIGKFHTPLELHRCYAWDFNKCVFTGADEGVYDTGNRNPAVPGKTSRSVYINGGRADGDSGVEGGEHLKDFSNCGAFKQCEFQGAKYGIDGYHIRQTKVDTCVFQYMWIGISNVVDDIHGAFNLGDIQLVGSNYFEYMAHSCLADVPVNDDGTIEPIPGKRRSWFYTDGSRQEFNGAQWVQLRSMQNRVLVDITSEMDAPEPPIEVRYDGVRRFSVDQNGVPQSTKGYDLSKTENFGDLISSECLDTYQRIVNVVEQPILGSERNPIANQFKQIFTNTGRICVMTIEANSFSLDGRGEFIIKIPDGVLPPRSYVDAKIIANYGGVGYDGMIYPVTQYVSGKPQIRFRKSVSGSESLTFSDISFGGTTNFQMSVIFHSFGK
ncbi:phage tail protein [Vibrio cyclitrophicus]|uniref:phage tail-collar fiber domain-containing protein n=1 Tax=Vibrio cyclitrophicus TaxID=47951 RepID=UPI0002F279AC|nr:phage tail protein [Vibrio cyclitrophicus]